VVAHLSRVHSVRKNIEPRAPLIERLTTPRRLLLIFGVIVLVTLAAQVRAVAQREGPFYKGGEVPIGADFFVFYSAGQIVASGDGDQLYDLDRQRTEQARTLGTDDFDGFLPFAYPAFVAAPYAVLSRLPFLWAYAVNTALMLAATGAAIWRLRSVSTIVDDHPALVALAVFASQPLVATNFGGLATAFSLLCFAGCYVSLRGKHDATAGVWLGLLLYKPQLAVPLLLLLLWRGRWRVAGVAGLVGLGLGFMGAAVAGWNWPRNFIDLARGDFYTNEARASGDRMISLLGVAEKAFGPKSAMAYGIAGSIALAVVALLIVAWRGAQPEGHHFPLQFGLAVAATLALSPHALFYEASLLIIPILLVVDSWRGEAIEVSGRRANGLLAIARSTRESIPGLSDGSRLEPTGEPRASYGLVLSPGGTSGSEPGNSVPGFSSGGAGSGNNPNTTSISPKHRLVLLCLFAFGYLWSLGPLLGFQPLAVVPLIVGLMAWLELPPMQRPGIKTVKWFQGLRFTWGESPNAPSGKRS
jgi:alpha-1,2-mannosyltransferase